MTNPELWRQWRANFSWQRLAFVSLLAALLTLTHSDKLSISKGLADKEFLFLWFYLLAGVWGCFSVLWALREERNSRAWHWHLMTPISPWSLVWARLLGALFFPWLGGLLVLSPAFLAEDFAAVAVVSVFLVLLANALAMFLGLTAGRLVGDREISLLWAGIPLALWPLVFLPADAIAWHGAEWDAAWFVSLSAAAFTGWALAGAWRLLAHEKRHPPMPLLWPLFVVFLILYSHGLMVDLFNEFNFAICAWAVLTFCAYAAILFRNNRYAEVKPFIDAACRRDWSAAWRAAPPWLVVLPFAVIALFVAFALGVGGRDAKISAHDLAILQALTLLVFRDIAIFLLFSLNDNNRLPERIAVVIWLVLHWLAPLLSHKLGWSAEIFSPFFANNRADINAGAAFASALAQCCFAIILLWRLRLR